MQQTDSAQLAVLSNIIQAYEGSKLRVAGILSFEVPTSGTLAIGGLPGPAGWSGPSSSRSSVSIPLQKIDFWLDGKRPMVLQLRIVLRVYVYWVLKNGPKDLLELPVAPFKWTLPKSTKINHTSLQQ